MSEGLNETSNSTESDKYELTLPMAVLEVLKGVRFIRPALVARVGRLSVSRGYPVLLQGNQEMANIAGGGGARLGS